MLWTLATRGGFVCAMTLGIASLSGGAHAADFKVLHTFTGGRDGGAPAAGLIRDSAGNLYGTAEFGGNKAHCAYGCGTVFRLAADGTFKVLHAFRGGTDGAEPYASLYRDGHGDLYGTTIAGGQNGSGTVFRLDSDGRERILHSFGASGDGIGPYAGLTRDSTGNFYGTTYQGGTAGAGTIFKLAPDGTETVLHSFVTGTDGGLPMGGVISDGAGDLYGTTTEWGPGDAGTVYRLAADGSFTALHAFPDPVDCLVPYGNLKRDDAGNLYGTTFFVAGCVFRLAPDGTETTLYTFHGGDGGFPKAGMIGNATGSVLYGTNSGGPYDSGSVFRFEGNVETVLHSFSAATDGAAPIDALVQDRAGNLYGTAVEGGAYNEGTVFEVSDK